MTTPPQRFFVWLLALVSWVGFAADACAQRGNKDPREVEIEARRQAVLERRQAEQEAGGKKSGEGKEGKFKEGKYEKGEDGEMVEAGPRPMKPFVVVTTGFDPRRVAPGGTADMKVVVSIRKKVLIASPQALQVTYPNAQGLVTLGDWQISDAKPSAIYESFAGQSVYDDTFTLTIPIQVGADAPHRVHPLRLNLLATLTDGQTGHSIGEYRLGVSGRLPVGDPLPTPTFRAAPGTITDGAVLTEDVATTNPGVDESAESQFDGDGVREERTAEPAAREVGVDDASPSFGEGPGDPAGDSNLLWIVGAVGVLLLIVLLLARKR